MTNRDELNALSNAEFGAWIAQMLQGRCTFCPAFERCYKYETRETAWCPQVIADWLRAEE